MTDMRPSHRWLGTTILAAMLISACSLSYGGTNTQASPDANTLSTGSPSIAQTSGSRIVQVVKAVEPSVVSVTSTTTVDSPFFGSQTQQGEGTGFIVAGDGVIFTNDHVVEGASDVKVTLIDGRSFAATVLKTDTVHDFAVLKIDASGLPTVTLGTSSELQLGASVVAIGYALGLSGGPTVTSGIISSLERTVQAQDPSSASTTRTYRNVLQTSAAINPGNSGGPLVDLQGRVVGINTASVSSADNIGFAIGIDAARPFIQSAIS